MNSKKKKIIENKWEIIYEGTNGKLSEKCLNFSEILLLFKM